MNYKQLDPRWTSPKVALLDDVPNEVKGLISNFESRNYSVTPFIRKEDFLEAVRSKVFPIQLIDVSLSTAPLNADGLQVAHECAMIHPEALRICISQILGDISVRDIIHVLKPRHDPELTLSLPAALGLRDIWAIYDKTTEIGKCRDLVEHFRATVACGDHTEIWVDDALAQDFDNGFESIRWNEPEAHIEPQVQVVEIVRQLARRPGMPPISKVTLKKLGKGRSRTVVANMSIEFANPAEIHLEGAPAKRRQSIIKIGRLHSIRRELSNYTQVVPCIFGTTFYPFIEATAVCRTLAGISYSCLGDGEEAIAPTLLDALFGKAPGISDTDAFESLRKATEFKRAQIVSRASETTKGDHLLNAYMERFTDLKPPTVDVTHAHPPKPRALLSDTLKAANSILADHGLITQSDTGERLFTLDAYRIPPASSIDELTRPFARWEDFWVGFVHGDLHLDNILLVQQGGSCANFYIDFADAGLHHAMLDFVVMDVAVRFQSLKYIPGLYDQTQEATLLRTLCRLEDALLNPSLPDWTPDGTLSEPLAKWALTTSKIAKSVRGQAYAYLAGHLRNSVIAEVEKRHRSELRPDEEIESEKYRFYCSVGLAGLAALHLPQSGNIVRIHQAWFAIVGQTYLSVFNQWKAVRR